MLDDLRKLIENLDEKGRTRSDWTDLQLTALELVPAASSLAQGIRVLIREGYLLSALVLLRPLLERIATLSYLAEHQQALGLWKQGWPHNSRPTLRARLATLMPGAAQPLLNQFTTAVSSYNGLVHGDPTAAQQSLMVTPSGVSYVTDRDYQTPGRANAIAVEAIAAIAFLNVNARKILGGETSNDAGA